MATARNGEWKTLVAALTSGELTSTLKAAGKSGADVVADHAREIVISDEVRGSIKTRVEVEDGVIRAHIETRGPGAYIAPWLEWGTKPHLIAADPSLLGGRSVRQFNRDAKRESLVINGKFVGAVVKHPGARWHPFMQPALDLGKEAALAKAQETINVRITRLARKRARG